MFDDKTNRKGMFRGGSGGGKVFSDGDCRLVSGRVVIGLLVGRGAAIGGRIYHGQHEKQCVSGEAKFLALFS